LEVVLCASSEAAPGRGNGFDALIPFYKDPDEYGPWNGAERHVISFTQSLAQRGEYCGYELFADLLAACLPIRVYGRHNEGLGPMWGGF
ncbi:hypothetical protein ACKXGD_17190, partial [Enterococcus lactis]|uniref:hypothetical protein n=1 Tax=Enterococcus lactis TaxID=357441 RepID=UPI00390822F5